MTPSEGHAAHAFGPMPDAIRGGAALVVAVAHTWQIFLYPLAPDSKAFYLLGSLAGWAVIVFFLLSGMLIAVSIKGRIDDGRFSPAAYFKARILRIHPPLIASVILVIAAVSVIQQFHLYGAESYLLPGDLASARPKAEFHWPDVLTTLGLTYWLVPEHGFLIFNGPLWSLSYEFWIYVLAGCLAAALVNRSLPFALASAALLYWIVFEADPLFVPIVIIWGAAFSVAWNWNRIGRLGSGAIALVGGAFLAAALWRAGSNIVDLFQDSRTDGPFLLTMSGFLLSCIVLLIRHQGQRPAGLTRLLERAGAFSYTLYLFHFPLMLFMLSLLRPLTYPLGLVGQVGLACFGLAVSIVVSRAAARFLEDRAFWSGFVSRLRVHPKRKERLS